MYHCMHIFAILDWVAGDSAKIMPIIRVECCELYECLCNLLAKLFKITHVNVLRLYTKWKTDLKDFFVLCFFCCTASKLIFIGHG